VIASEKVPQDENGAAISWPGAVGGSQEAMTVLRDVCFGRKCHISGTGFRERHLMGFDPAGHTNVPADQLIIKHNLLIG
jgi:hypothetical protein